MNQSGNKGQIDHTMMAYAEAAYTKDSKPYGDTSLSQKQWIGLFHIAFIYFLYDILSGRSIAI